MSQERQVPTIDTPILTQRRRQLVEWVVIWRLMALICIPLAAWVNPGNIGSVPRALSLSTIAFVYIAIHGILFLAFPARQRLLRFIDLTVCSSFMLASGVPRVVFLTTMFATSSLLAYRSTRIRNWLPTALFLSAAYFAAEHFAGLSPIDTLTRPAELGVLVLIYFFGMGFMALDIVLDRLTFLEMEGLLEKQRQGYRRRLHDDLGNTLCGLHFRIEMLVDTEKESLRHALEYISGGYKRAVQVLSSILNGMEEMIEADINDSLARLKAELESDTGVAINLSGDTAGANLSPELVREVMAITRESALNACKHSGVTSVSIFVTRLRRCLRITVSDRGAGFNSEKITARQSEGHRGVMGMYERASLIGADLEMSSLPGQGTRVDLDVRIPQSSRFGRILEQDVRQTGKLYSVIVFLKIPVLLLVLVQIGMLPDDRRHSTAGLIIAGGLTFNCIFWVFFRPFIYQWLKQRPWLLSIDLIYLAVIFYAGQRFGYAQDFFYIVYPESAFILGGLFLGVRGNLKMAAGFTLAIICSYFIAVSPPGTVSQGRLLEDLFTFVAAVVAIAFACGLAGDFVKRLEREQREAIYRSLAREREQMTVETHHQLHDLITALGERLGALAHASHIKVASEKEITDIKSLSRDLKKRLRSIIVALESPTSTDE